MTSASTKNPSGPHPCVAYETPADWPLDVNLEEWASFTAALHFRGDLVEMVRLRSEARRRAAQRQR